MMRAVSAFACLALFALTPMAYASPPDQTWIPGLYDNADFDDVIIFITSGLGGIQPDPVWYPHVAEPVVGFVLSLDTRLLALAPVSSAPSRAPPFLTLHP